MSQVPAFVLGIVLVCSSAAPAGPLAEDLCERHTNKQGKLDGLVKCSWPNGKARSTVRYVDGKKQGELLEWDSEGRPVKTETYQSDRLNGPAQYFEAGILVEEANFQNGHRDGKCKKYESGKVSRVGTYRNGQEVGFEQFWPSGKIEERGAFGDQGLEGLHEKFFENGKIESRCSFKKGELDGPCEGFYENGQSKVQVTYVQGKYQGELKRFLENGTQYEFETYHQGKREGLARYYSRDDGQLVEEVAFKDDQKDGIEKEYYRGKLSRIRTYQAGSEIGPFQEFYSNGNLKARGTSGKRCKEGALETFHENGKLEEKMTLVACELEGPRSTYYPNGNPKWEAVYRNGKEHGLQKHYAENGTLLETRCYQDGHPVTGLAPCSANMKPDQPEELKEFFADGRPRKIESVKDGKRQGETKLYHQNGNLAESAFYADDRRDGPTKTFWENGQPRSVCNFKKNIKDGSEENFFEDGKIKEQITWKDGEQIARMEYWMNGKSKLSEVTEGNSVISKIFSDDGRLKEEFVAVLGRRQGPAKTYHPNGTVKLVLVYEKDRVTSLKEYDDQGKLLRSEEYYPDGSRK